MTDSIVLAISRFLTPDVIGKLASASGLSSTAAQSAVAAVVPSILSGLASLVARPGGAQQLATAVTEQPTEILGSLASSLTGSAQVAEKGTSLLSSLLGSGALGTLASSVSGFAGIGQGSTRTLMGLLTPLIMGVLGREQQTAGLDTNGLARMLTRQKDEIAAAMPSGLSRLLDRSGLYETIGSASSPEGRTHEPPYPVSDAPHAAYDPPRVTSTQRMVSDAKKNGLGVSWAYWVLPLLALAGLLWYLLPSGRETVEPVRTSQAKSIYLTSAPNNWVSISGLPNDYVNKDIFNRSGHNLGTIRDVLVGPDGKMTAAIVNVGRFLGIGDKDIAVPFSALEVEQRDNGRQIVMDASKDALQAAPIFTGRQTPR